MEKEIEYATRTQSIAALKTKIRSYTDELLDAMSANDIDFVNFYAKEIAKLSDEVMQLEALGF